MNRIGEMKMDDNGVWKLDGGQEIDCLEGGVYCPHISSISFVLLFSL